MLTRRLPSLGSLPSALPWLSRPPSAPRTLMLSFVPKNGFLPLRFICQCSAGVAEAIPHEESKFGILKPGLYLVGTPIGNLEDITFRLPLRCHKFNESRRAQTVLTRLKGGEIVASISDAGSPGISDPGMDLVKLCVEANIPVIPVPGRQLW